MNRGGGKPELRIVPDAGDAERAAIRAALERAAVRRPSPPAAPSAWWREGIRANLRLRGGG